MVADEGVGVQEQVGLRFIFLHVIQTDSGVQPVSNLMGTGGSFSRGKTGAA
jgi:hypothetical protein